MSGTPTVPGWYINFQAAVLKQLPRPDEIDRDTADGWESNQASLKKYLAECLLPPVKKNKSTVSVLHVVNVVTMSATTTKLFAKKMLDFLRYLSVYSLDENFTKWFLSGEGKIEDPIAEHKLCYADLVHRSRDIKIISELGGKVKVETSLTDISHLINKQQYGGEGDLLTNGQSNIFYVRDQKNILRVVNAFFVVRRWHLHAIDIFNGDRWGIGHRVFYPA